MARKSFPNISKNQVLVRMLASPVNPSDCGQIGGLYPLNSDGNLGGEGVGIVEVSLSAKYSPGDLVIPRIPGTIGVWREKILVDEDLIIGLEKFKDLPIEVVSSILINPLSAILLLRKYSTLVAGDSVIINGSRTQVGKYIEDLCRVWGLSFWSLERPPPPNIKCKLALDCIGGKESGKMMDYLSNNSSHIIFGGMKSRLGIGPLSTGKFIFKNLSMKGFWLPLHLKEHCIRTLLNEVCDLFINGSFREPQFRKINFHDPSLPKVIEEYSSNGWKGGKPLIIF